MKKILIAIPLFVVLFGLLLAGIGYVLPKEYEVTREVFIEAPPAVVYEELVELKNWPNWSYWTVEHVEGLEVTLGEQTRGEGATQTWVDATGAEGSLQILATSTNEKVATEMRYGEFPAMTSLMSLQPETQEVSIGDGETKTIEGTTLTWYSKGELGNDPLSGWFGLLMPSLVGKQYDYGLQKLKGLCESQETPGETASDDNAADDEAAAEASDGSTADEDQSKAEQDARSGTSERKRS